jgi:hypothetical protein
MGSTLSTLSQDIPHLTSLVYVQVDSIPRSQYRKWQEFLGSQGQLHMAIYANVDNDPLVLIEYKSHIPYNHGSHNWHSLCLFDWDSGVNLLQNMNSYLGTPYINYIFTV